MGEIYNQEYLESIALSKEIQAFIEDHIHKDSSFLLFKNQLFDSISNTELVQQINGRKKALKKLPSWYKNKAIWYHETINLEQCSSEITATYKSKLFSGNNMIDITAGMGVDTYFIGKQFKEVYFTEYNASLAVKTLYNLRILGITSLYGMEKDGITFLKETPLQFDLLYIDPARRADGNKKFLLSDCQPNILDHIELFKNKSKQLAIKISPLFDLKELTTHLPDWSSIHLIAVKNELKEILLITNFTPTFEQKIFCVNLNSNQPIFSAQIGDCKEVQYTQELKKYLYEPNVSIMKAGFFNRISNQFSLEKLDKNTHLYTADEFHENFPGKIFQIYEILPSKIIKKWATTHYNIISKNYPLTVAQIKKKYGLKEGGEDFLFFTSINSKLNTILCSKISS